MHSHQGSYVEFDMYMWHSNCQFVLQCSVLQYYTDSGNGKCELKIKFTLGQFKIPKLMYILFQNIEL